MSARPPDRRAAELPIAAPPKVHCQLTLEHVDDVQARAHRISVFGHLIASTLESRPDVISEGLAALTTEMIADAEAINELIMGGAIKS